MYIETKNLVKTFSGRNVVDGVSLRVDKGQVVGLLGPNGAGKTTSFYMIVGIERPSSGIITVDGKDITKLKNKELSNLRKDKIGFVFQDYNLLDTMTLQDNIALPLSLNGVSSKECIQKTNELAEMFGLREHLKKYPYQLSGGQKQRGATCRALITDPEIIFADEPTGALDSKSSHDLLECLKLVNDNDQATILMVTHDAFSASYAKEVYILSDGAIKCKLTKGQNQKEFYDRIIEMQASMGSDFS